MSRISRLRIMLEKGTVSHLTNTLVVVLNKMK